MRPTIGSRNLPQLVSLMSYECPVCVHPKLIHGSYFTSDKEGEKEFVFTLAKKGEKDVIYHWTKLNTATFTL